MILQFHCPTCNELVSADSEYGGDIAQCPECDSQIMVPMDAVGTGMVVGNYKLLKKLGNGGMGDVYMAEQPKLGRQVALKVLPPVMTRDSKIAERFLQEMRNQAALNHPNIATAYDAGKDRDIYYLAMEYVEGVDLSRILNKREKLPEREALRIALEVARGLDYAWYKKKIIHRDIKPGNIIVSKDAEVRILDMGLSRSMTEVVDLSGTNYLVGTPLYMSPEQLDSDVTLDFRTDMYSLGTTLYHMLTGQTPFQGKTVTQILAQRATQDPTPIRELNPEVSEGCAVVVEAMMARKRDERFSDWPAAIASINQALEGVVPLTPGGIAAAQKAVGDSSLIQTQTGTTKAPVPADAPGDRSPVAAAPPQKNPMIPVYLGLLGVAALALLTTLVGFIKMKPRYIEVPVQVAADTSADNALGKLSDRLGSVVKGSAPAPTLPLSPVATVTTNPVPPPPASTASAEEEARLRKQQEDERARDEVQALYDFSVENLLESPEDFDPHIEAFAQVKKEAERLDMFTLKETAEEEINRLKKLKRDRIESLLARLQEQATVAIDAGEYRQAEQLVKNYNGPMMAETAHARQTLASSVSKKADTVRKTRKLEADKANKAYKVLIKQLTDVVTTNRTVEALSGIITPAKTDAVFEPIREKVYQLDGVVNLVVDIEKNVLFTFRGDIGKTIDIEFQHESKSLMIKSIDEDKVVASQFVDGGGTLGFSFSPSDLSVRERLQRIENAYGDRAPFVLGFMALQAGKESTALEYFKQTDNDLTPGVVRRVEVLARQKEENALAQAQAALEREAKWAFANVLHSARLPTGDVDENKLLDAMAGNEYDEDRLRVINLMASSFLEKYGSTQLADTYHVLLKQLSGQSFRAMTVAALKDALKSRNPAYDGGGVFETNQFSVVQADFNGAGNIGNLLPLKNLPLHGLRISGPQIRELTALRGMPLRSLVLKGTAIKDLSPLKGAPLESLSLEDSKNVQNIKVLREAELKFLNLQGTAVGDLKPLAGQPIEQLLVGHNTRDLTALGEAPLKKLSLANSKVRNLAPLKGKSLEFLDLLNTPVVDLGPLDGQPLKVLKLNPKKISSGLEELRKLASLVQFQIAPGVDMISAEQFWKLFDEGAFGSEQDKGAENNAEETVKR